MAYTNCAMPCDCPTTTCSCTILEGPSGGQSVIGSGTGFDPYLLDVRLDPNPNNIIQVSAAGLLVDGTAIITTPARTFTNVTVDYLTTGLDDFITVDSLLGTVDVSLDALPADGKTQTIKWVLGANTVRLLGNGNTIDFSATPYTFASLYESLDVTWNATHGTWLVN